MIRAHQLHARWRQYSFAIQFSTVAEHLRKALVILCRRHHAAAARWHHRLRFILTHPAAWPSLRRNQLAVWTRRIERHEPAALLRRHIEPRVSHAQWHVNMVADEIRQRLPRKLLNDVALNIH